MNGYPRFGWVDILRFQQAGKTKDMSQIKQLLLLKKEGVSNRKAAKIVSINKETANNYVGFINLR